MCACQLGLDCLWDQKVYQQCVQIPHLLRTYDQMLLLTILETDFGGFGGGSWGGASWETYLKNASRGKDGGKVFSC